MILYSYILCSDLYKFCVLISLPFSLTRSCIYCNYHIFTDYLQIYYHFRLNSFLDTFSRVNEYVKFVEWSKAHGLALNASKTKSMVIDYSRLLIGVDLNSAVRLFADGLYHDSFTSLVVLIDKTLCWSSQVSIVYGRVFYGMHQLNRSAFFRYPFEFDWLKYPVSFCLIAASLCSIIFTKNKTMNSRGTRIIL